MKAALLALLATAAIDVHAQTAPSGAACLRDASLTAPVLTAECAAACGYSENGFCVYYPGATKGDCSGVLDNRCVPLAECTFECFARNPNYVYLYDTADGLDRMVQSMLLESPSRAFAGVINTTLVRRMHSTPINITKIKLVAQPSRFVRKDFDRGGIDATFPMVDFTLPDSFFRDAAASAEHIELSALPVPVSPDAFEASRLELLFLDNCGVTSLPWLEKSVPNIKSMISITDSALEDVRLPRAALEAAQPSKAIAIFLYNNRLTTVPRELATTTGLDEVRLSHNPLGTIPKGSLPIAYDRLYVKNCSLTDVPPDLATATIHTLLDLSYNPLGTNFELSKLPAKLDALKVGYTGQTALPAGIQTRPFTFLDFSGHQLVESDLANLPPTLTALILRDGGFQRIPPAIATLTDLTHLDLRENPITSLDAKQLPGPLRVLELSDATFTTVSLDGLVADSAVLLNISNSALTTITSFNLDTTDFANVILANNSITTLPSPFTFDCQVLDLSRNKLTAFEATTNVSAIVDLSYNQLESVRLTVLTTLRSLNLRGNKLTSMPDSILSIDTLQVLDIRDNPITAFKPTPLQMQQLSRLSLVLMDGSQVAGGDCRVLGAQFVCDYTGQGDTASPDDDDGFSSSATPSSTPDATLDTNRSTTSTSNSLSTATIIGVVVGVVVLILVLAITVRYRRRHQPRPNDNTSTLGKSLMTTRSSHGGGDGSAGSSATSSSVLDDDDLIKHRLDFQAVSIQRVLASGTYGEVFLAKYLGERVVVKRLKNQANCSRQQIQDFASEIKVLAHLTFPKIVPFLGVVWTKETDLGVVTAYMANGDLRMYLAKHKHAAFAGWTSTKLRIARDVAEALVYLHSLSPARIHRDLKSLNVLLDDRLSACLSDFGSSRELPEDVATLTWGVGTALWMAPEVLHGGRYDTSADVFSMGVILSELDTHLLPYAKWGREEAGGDGDGSDSRQSVRIPEKESSLLSGDVIAGAAQLVFLESCPVAVRELALRCVAREPKERPTAMDIAYTLRRLLREEGGFC